MVSSCTWNAERAKGYMKLRFTCIQTLSIKTRHCMMVDIYMTRAQGNLIKMRINSAQDVKDIRLQSGSKKQSFMCILLLKHSPGVASPLL